MRINKMITTDKILWPFIKFSQLILKGDVWRSVWRICMWILGLLKRVNKMWDQHELTVYGIVMFIDIFSYQLCGLTRRISSQPQDTQRSHQVNPTCIRGCPPQTLYTASPSFGNCLYSGKYWMVFITITNTPQTLR